MPIDRLSVGSPNSSMAWVQESVALRELPEGLPPNAQYVVLEPRVREALHDLVDILAVLPFVEPVSAHQRSARLVSQGGVDDCVDLRVAHRGVDSPVSLEEAQARDDGVAAVEGEELAFDVGLQVFREFHALQPDWGAAQSGFVYNSLVEIFDADVEGATASE